ncbi:hypothetical protein LEP1GSC133_0392 [Leptospira borgpetersenii serovar Pomona str. 200901868]|uniref:Uncharacterized protein n=1 Tax=Leptospira borgpetersenii serovar Pomona str. 200901868 TaxID=1192866 RepID=M6W3B4_LEPBO|nr:hypothetical protein LEP1GSC133_0392 [Leptospira borgpetersenii serovar Pomona str. 200901868]
MSSAATLSPLFPLFLRVPVFFREVQAFTTRILSENFSANLDLDVAAKISVYRGFDGTL